MSVPSDAMMAGIVNSREKRRLVSNLPNQIILVNEETGQALIQFEDDTMHRTVCEDELVVIHFYVESTLEDGDTLTIYFCFNWILLLFFCWDMHIVTYGLKFLVMLISMSTDRYRPFAAHPNLQPASSSSSHTLGTALGCFTPPLLTAIQDLPSPPQTSPSSESIVFSCA